MLKSDANAVATITVISDNRAAPGLESEHGFSLWIECGGKRILLDCGNTRVMLRNAEKLGIDLGQADHIVLSHGHYDHTGNLFALLQTAPDTRLHLHRDALIRRFSIHATPKTVGAPDQALSSHRIPRIAPCHCTGSRAMEFLLHRVGSNVTFGHAGMALRV